MGQRPGDGRPAREDPASAIGTLLEEIERERVPERLLELATRLQEALDARRRAAAGSALD